jgi:host factor-I protein
MPELDINQPSTRQIQQLIKEKTKLELKLVTGDVLSGELFWQDADYFCLTDQGSNKIIISKLAVAYLKPL